VTKYARLARATACATLLTIPASAMGAQATVRVEGASGTVIPETAYEMPAPSTTTLLDTGDGDTMTVDSRSAAAQLGAVTTASNLGLGFTDYGGALGFGLDSIGGVSSDWVNGPVWFLKVNHVFASSGAGSVILSGGDEVLWALGPYDPVTYELALDELDISADIAKAPEGSPITMTVSRYNNDGRRRAAAGVTVTYGAATAVTDAGGTASVTADGKGPATVVATAPGAVRDATRVCTYPASDPTVCDLPALPPTQAPTAQAPTETVRVQVTITTSSGPVNLTVTIPVPRPGTAPLAIRRSMITGADLTPAELRRALGAVASAAAAQLNERASQGEDGIVPPFGTRWRAAWLSGTPYVAPLRGNESFLGILRDGPRNVAAMRARARSFGSLMRHCDITGAATAVTRHGYAMTLIRPASARSALVKCASGGAASGR
jgi:hypothetical protein